jgi:hypothetical protein
VGCVPKGRTKRLKAGALVKSGRPASKSGMGMSLAAEWRG